MLSVVLGIDVSKKTLDVTFLNAKGGKRRKRVANTLAGINTLIAWLQKQTSELVHVCMESTSVYWEDVAEALNEAGHQVSVVNPVRIKGYAMSQLRRSKTDPLDADVIADFCRTQKPDLWQPPTSEQKKLRALVRHLETLKKSRTQQQNRLGTCRDAEVKASLEKILALLEEEIEMLERRIRDFVNQQPDLKEKKDLLVSIKGFGEKTAIHILAEMYDLAEYKNAKAAAADAGVTTSHYSSGTSVRKRPKMSRIGKATIRSALYFPAISAIQHNPVIKRLAQRLAAKGKEKAVIRVAVMRKLMHLAFGVLKNKI
ncbi:MAG: IS110 family transposase, partial [Chloroflexi bacterium]|nr:IS110 family transposase [Chloroflexota bacterium]